MVNKKQCTTCGANLVNRRSHARFCSAACRCRSWREAQLNPVSIKIILPRLEFIQLKNEADSLGVLINQLIVSRALQGSACSISV